jgi:formylmethanofuran dehydrogenase subunit B
VTPKENIALVADATCTRCGCLCDDIVLSVAAEGIIEARNACAKGEEWFLRDRPDEGSECLIEGVPATVESGIERAAAILSGANHPAVLLLGESTAEAYRTAIAIADRIGACVDVPQNAGSGSAVLAFQEVGESTCTLGEIKNRSDLIIFWRCDPVESHPRHLSRYSLEAAGLFVPGGRVDRYALVIDVAVSATSRVANEFLAIKNDGEFEALWTLRALAKGVELDPLEVEAQTGVPLSRWQGLMDRMKRARYGAFFTGPGAHSPSSVHQNAHALLALVRDLNAFARFVCVPLGSPGNGPGAENVLTWQTGYPLGVTLARGYPRFGPSEFTAESGLGRGECDLALVIGGDPAPYLSSRARSHLGSIPTIVISGRENPMPRGALVGFSTATYGVESGGTVYRCDGVALPLRPALSSPRPTDLDILTKIDRRLRELAPGDDSSHLY